MLFFRVERVDIDVVARGDEAIELLDDVVEFVRVGRSRIIRADGRDKAVDTVLVGHEVAGATEAKIREINTLIEKLPAGTGYLVTYKDGINSLVAAVRAYNAGPPDPNKLGNVVEEFNHLAAMGNNVDVNALDAKK